MDNPVENFYITSIKRYLEQFLYWQLEINEDLLNGDINSIMPCLFMADKLHNISWYYEKIKDKDKNNIDWQKIYMEASEKARKQFFEEHNKD